MEKRYIRLQWLNDGTKELENANTENGLKINFRISNKFLIKLSKNRFKIKTKMIW